MYSTRVNRHAKASCYNLISFKSLTEKNTNDVSFIHASFSLASPSRYFFPTKSTANGMTRKNLVCTLRHARVKERVINSFWINENVLHTAATFRASSCPRRFLLAALLLSPPLAPLIFFVLVPQSPRLKENL